MQYIHIILFPLLQHLKDLPTSLPTQLYVLSLAKKNENQNNRQKTSKKKKMPKQNKNTTNLNNISNSFKGDRLKILVMDYV